MLLSEERLREIRCFLSDVMTDQISCFTLDCFETEMSSEIEIVLN